MIWPVVARRYMESFQQRARQPRRCRRARLCAVRTLENRPYELPPLKLDHLFRMSDATGIFQHAIFNVPNYAEGYCMDDNARAFILTLLLPEMTTRVAREDMDALGQHLSRVSSGMPLTERTPLPELHEPSSGNGWKQGLGRQPCARALGRGHGAGSVEERWPSQSLRAAFSTRPASGRELHFAACLGLRAPGDARISAQFFRRPDGRTNCVKC